MGSSSQAHPTTTKSRLLKAETSFLSKGGTGLVSQGEVSNYGLQAVTVERFYPQTMEAKVRYIANQQTDTDKQEGNENIPVKAKILSPSLSKDVLDTCIYAGTPELDPDTGVPSVVPDDTDITGVVEALDGDINGNGLVLLGYTYSSEDGVLLVADNCRLIRYEDSEIILKKGEIEINTPKLVINGVDVTNSLQGGTE